MVDSFFIKTDICVFIIVSIITGRWTTPGSGTGADWGHCVQREHVIVTCPNIEIKMNRCCNNMT